MRETGQRLGPARDLDVFIEALAELRQELPATATDDLEPFVVLVRRERAAQQPRLLAWLSSPSRLAAFGVDLGLNQSGADVVHADAVGRQLL